jgi:hypothetical protein
MHTIDWPRHTTGRPPQPLLDHINHCSTPSTTARPPQPLLDPINHCLITSTTAWSHQPLLDHLNHCSTSSTTARPHQPLLHYINYLSIICYILLTLPSLYSLMGCKWPKSLSDHSGVPDLEWYSNSNNKVLASVGNSEAVYNTDPVIQYRLYLIQYKWPVTV